MPSSGWASAMRRETASDDLELAVLGADLERPVLEMVASKLVGAALDESRRMLRLDDEGVGQVIFQGKAFKGSG